MIRISGLLIAALALLSLPAQAQMVTTKTLQYTANNSDCDQQGKKLILLNITSPPGAGLLLPIPGPTNGFLAGCQVNIINLNAVTVTISVVASGATFNGQNTFTLAQRKSATIMSDATPAAAGNYYVLGQ